MVGWQDILKNSRNKCAFYSLEVFCCCLFVVVVVFFSGGGGDWVGMYLRWVGWLLGVWE